VLSVSEIILFSKESSILNILLIAAESLSAKSNEETQ
jgi:hypothetical protein